MAISHSDVCFFQAKSAFIDDDKVKHLEYEYSFKIAKEFDE